MSNVDTLPGLPGLSSRLVDVGGYHLRLIIGGPTAAPEASSGGRIATIVLDAGLAQVGLCWSRVVVRLATFAQVCAYDRAGYGLSDAGPLPRTSSLVVSELHTALRVAGLPGPYVLVGHSWGGMSMRLFASEYPDEVAGLVLVDSYNADLYLRDQALFHAFMAQLQRTFGSVALAGRLGLLRPVVALRRNILPTFITQQPASILPAVVASYLNGSLFATAASEIKVIETSVAQARDAAQHAGLSDLPLAVLTHGQQGMFAGLPAPDAGRAEHLWQQSQADLAHASARGRLISATRSGHDIHVEQPELVVEAIQWVAGWTQARNAAVEGVDGGQRRF